MTAPPTTALCAILRNEIRGVVEWLAHYKALGVDEFLIYDNASDDGTEALLAALAEAGEIDADPLAAYGGRTAAAPGLCRCAQAGAGGLAGVFLMRMNFCFCVRTPPWAAFCSGLTTASARWRSIGWSLAAAGRRPGALPRDGTLHRCAAA
ncbi:MAG: glycosyltransferase family 92 protein, partial [Rhodobacteraceae bacterium]|nr:glycosyltransferase family 92 protein [Paracoccaceae bacterium]